MEPYFSITWQNSEVSSTNQYSISKIISLMLLWCSNGDFYFSYFFHANYWNSVRKNCPLFPIYLFNFFICPYCFLFGWLIFVLFALNSISFLYGTTKGSQAHLVFCLIQHWNQPVLQKVPISFIVEWYSKPVFRCEVATGISLLLGLVSRLGWEREIDRRKYLSI